VSNSTIESKTDVATSASVTPANQPFNINNQADPLMLLMQYATTTQDLEISLNGAVGQVTQCISDGATSGSEAGDNALTAQSNYMATLTGTQVSSQLTQQNAIYTAMQASVSNQNNQYSNTEQGMGTMLSDGVNTVGMQGQFETTVNEIQSNVNNLIMSIQG